MRTASVMMRIRLIRSAQSAGAPFPRFPFGAVAMRAIAPHQYIWRDAATSLFLSVPVPAPPSILQHRRRR
ncbi:hypothetical protein E2542_SST01252 [Spatholobus suberectus]|nr:hypothetical protein E2542_SST01252 [Spatholobus suberectus]